MTINRSLRLISLLLLTLPQIYGAIYEDQVGKFDWKRSYIGKVKFAKFDGKKVIVATEDNVLASLNTKNGNINWRQVMEHPNEHTIRFLNVGKSAVTVSGNGAYFIVRNWDIRNGILINSFPINVAKNYHSEFAFEKDFLYHILVVSGSHIEIVRYNVNTGESHQYSVATPWVNNNCVVTWPYYVCASSEDTSGSLNYVNLVKNGTSASKSILSIFGSEKGRVMLIEFKNNVPSVLIVVNNVGRVVIFNDEEIEIKKYDLMPNAIIVYDQIFQLEAGEHKEKLIRVKSKEYSTGNDIFKVDLEYPVGLGAPIILDCQIRESITDLLLTTTDSALLLVRLPEGKILWTREEALSNIVATEFVELPVSELDASIEHEFDPSGSIFSMFIHRISTQARQIYSLIFGGQLLSDKSMVRDEFGLHKIIVVATKVGKIFAIDTISGSIAWSYRLPNVSPFDEKMMIFLQRTARYAPKRAHCVIFARDSFTNHAVMFEFDPITGYSKNGAERLNFKLKQALMLSNADEDFIRPIIVVSDNNEAYFYPNTHSALKIIQNNHENIFFYTINNIDSTLNGYSFKYSTENTLKLSNAWNINLSPSKIISTTVRPSNERVHSQGRVMYDRSVYYKYVNPNMIAVATVTSDPVHKNVVSIYLIDGVTGFVVYSTTHKRSKGPVHIVHSENWLVYTYFNERFRRTEIGAAELYEGHIQSNSSVFSSLAISQLPHTEKQAYILPAVPTSMAVTITERGITNKFLLIALSGGSVIEVPWLLLQPRFENVPCGPEESCIPYMPEIPLPYEAIINYNQTIFRVKGIEVAPARLESTSHVLVHGLDIFYTRVAPSKTFDVLKEDFDHRLIVLVLSGLIIASYFTKYLASKKALKQAWK